MSGLGELEPNIFSFKSPFLLPELESKTPPDTKAFIDSVTEIRPELFSCDESTKNALQFLPWKTMLSSPFCFQLPVVISYTPTNPPPSFQTGSLWGILVWVEINRPKLPHHEGIVFMCGDQSQKPPLHLSPTALWNWAKQEKNCPSSMRFRSLREALRVLCGPPTSPFHVPAQRADKYFPALQMFRVTEWNVTLERLIKDGVEMHPYFRQPPLKYVPVQPKKPRKKRKKPAKEDRVEIPKSTTPEELDISFISSFHDDPSSWT